MSANTRRSHWPISILSSLAAAVNLLLPLVLVRLLTPHEVGLFKVFFLYVTIIPGFAMTSGLMSGLGFWAGKGEHGLNAVRASALLMLGASIVFASIGLAAFPLFGAAFGWNETTALAFAAALFGSIAGSFFEEAAISRGRIWTGALFYVGFELVRTGAIICAAIMFRSLEAIYIVHAVVITAKAMVGYCFGYRLGLVRFWIDRPTIRSVIRYAAPVSTAWVFGIIVGYADQLILSTRISPSDFAFYTIGCLSVAPLLILEQSITRVLIPELARAFNAGQSDEAARLLYDGVRNLAFLLIPATVGLVVFAEPIITLLFTSAYTDASRYLAVFALTYLCLIFPHDAVARARGQAGWILRNFVAFSGPTLAATLAGVWLGGAMGALYGMVVSKVALRLYAVRYAAKTTGWRVGAFVPIGSLLRMGLYAVFLGLMVSGMRIFFDSALMWFVVSGTLFAALYLPGAFLMEGGAAVRGRSDKVLVVTQRVSIGGLERMILHLCRHLVRQGGWQVKVLGYDHGVNDERGFLDQFAADGIAVELFKKPARFSPRVVAKIVRYVVRERVAVVHTHDLGGLIYGVVAKALMGGRVRLVHTQHSFLHLGMSRRYAWYERFFARFADELTVVSSSTREQYGALGYDVGRIHLIENGVDFIAEPTVERREKERLRSRLLAGGRSDLSQRAWIVYIARLYPGKGQDHAIELWRALSPPVRQRAALFLVGPEASPGESARIGALAATAPDGDSIVLVGGSAAPDEWLRAGDIYLSCSEFEGMPLGPLEAVGAGLPAVLSSIAGHEFLRASSAQFALDDIATGAWELSRVIGEVKERGERYHAELWVKNRWVRERFSIAAMGERYAALYANTAANPGG
jgi:O-antigen/teichoic acid export membrane protein/glycosyltransferase involved in cell wall biosynthesis